MYCSCYLLPSFLQEFESHDGGLSQDKWVFYFNDEAEKERFLKALSDIWIKFFQVQYMNLHMKTRVRFYHNIAHALVLSPVNKIIKVHIDTH